MTNPDEIPEVEIEADEMPDDSTYPDTLSCPDGQIHFGVDAQTFLAYWLGKLGHDVEGAALLVGDGLSIGILVPDTGQVLTIPDLVKLAKKPGVSRVQ